MGKTAAAGPLSEVEHGTRVIIAALTGGREARRRLMNMGLHVGRDARVLRSGNGSGPILLATGETRLAVGQGMARKIMVVRATDFQAHVHLGQSGEGGIAKKALGQGSCSDSTESRRESMEGKRIRSRTDSVRKPARLSDYEQGQKGKIVKVQGDDGSRRRMSEMGFTRGIEVEVVKAAPLTDPVEYLIKGYHVSLRREQAADILMDQPDREAGNHE